MCAIFEEWGLLISVMNGDHALWHVVVRGSQNMKLKKDLSRKVDVITIVDVYGFCGKLPVLAQISIEGSPSIRIDE